MQTTTIRAATITALAAFVLLALPGCPMYTAAYWQEMAAEREQMLVPAGRAQTAEYELDRGIADAFDMLVRTIPPGNRRVERPAWLNPLVFRPKLWRVGFVLMPSDGENYSRIDGYVAEKAVLLARLTEPFGRYYEVAERARLDDVYREIRVKQNRASDASALQQWGRKRGLAFIITGVTAASQDYIDVTLRMDAVKSGRVVAVGSSKVRRVSALEDWLLE